MFFDRISCPPCPAGTLGQRSVIFAFCLVRIGFLEGLYAPQKGDANMTITHFGAWSGAFSGYPLSIIILFFVNFVNLFAVFICGFKKIWHIEQNHGNAIVKYTLGRFSETFFRFFDAFF